MFHLSYISSLPVPCFACGTGIFFVNQQRESIMTKNNITCTTLTNELLDKFIFSKASSIGLDATYRDVPKCFTHVIDTNDMFPTEIRTVVRFYNDEDIKELVDWTRKNFAFDVWFDCTSIGRELFYTGACRDADVHDNMIEYAFKVEHIRISIIEDNTIHHLLVWAMGNRPYSKRVS